MLWLQSIAALLLLLPFMALAQPACYPSATDPAARWGGLVRHADGAGWYWYCWDATVKGCQANYLVMHRGDIARAPIDVAARSRQFTATAPADWPALFAAWDKDTSGDCAAQIANAGYASALCLATRTAMQAGLPADTPAAPPPPPPPPPATWKVAPNLTYTTRPTYAWFNGVRASASAAERVAVGAPCDPAIGAGSYRGVLGRADRVAFCVEVKP